MNLIVCGENCRHAKEGYCALDHVTQLSGSTQKGCGYFAPFGEGQLAMDGRIPPAPDLRQPGGQHRPF